MTNWKPDLTPINDLSLNPVAIDEAAKATAKAAADMIERFRSESPSDAMHSLHRANRRRGYGNYQRARWAGLGGR